MPRCPDQTGIDTSAFTHRILLLPPGSPCASVGAGIQSCAFDDNVGTYGACFLLVKLETPVVPKSTILHELGHNLGLGHAAVYDPSNSINQKDTSSVM